MFKYERIKTIRKSLGFHSREKFAEELQIPFPTLRAYEQGKIENIPHSFLATLASKFNVNINWLISGNGEMFIKKDTFTQYGDDNQQIGTQNNPYSSDINNFGAGAAKTQNKNIDEDILKLVEALNSVANALNKKQELKNELTKLIETLSHYKNE